MSSVLTVTTPAATRDLTTLATVKDELGITDSDSDTRLRRWIREASGAIERYTRHVWAKETVVETFCHGTDRFCRIVSTSLCLSRYPVTDVASITEDGVALETTDYSRYDDYGILYRLSSAGTHVSWPGATTAVTYTAGYDLLDGLPPELEQACLTLMKHRWSSRSRDPLLRQIDVPGVQSETYWVGTTADDNGAIPAEIRGLLDPFRECRL